LNNQLSVSPSFEEAEQQQSNSLFRLQFGAIFRGRGLVLFGLCLGQGNNSGIGLGESKGAPHKGILEQQSMGILEN